MASNALSTIPSMRGLMVTAAQEQATEEIDQVRHRVCRGSVRTGSNCVRISCVAGKSTAWWLGS